MRRASSVAGVVFALPLALAGCPALLSDWTISGSGGHDASADTSSPDAAGGGSDGSSSDGSSTSSGSASSSSGSSGGSSSGSSSSGSSSGSSSSGSSGTSNGGSSGASSGGSSGSPLSCQASGNGLTNCGAASESCCTSLAVPGGTYYRTYNTADSTSGPPDGGWTDEADPATISSFSLDKYLVTVGRFRQFVNAWNNGYLPAEGSGKHAYLNGGSGLSATTGGYEPGWVTADDGNVAPTNANLACDTYATWTTSAETNENLPIDCVSWWESYAFCIWDGGFLPSEAEWEYAAAGGSEQREYPWGAAAPGTTNTYAIYGCNYPDGSGCTTTVSNDAPVGFASAGAGLWGQLDLSGDMDEWNLDWYAAYAPCEDCADFTPSANGRVVRGCDDGDTMSRLLPSTRDSFSADRHSGVGMRCARTP
jgi:formylglycine-generating enzyme required for sulfatase activity